MHVAENWDSSWLVLWRTGGFLWCDSTLVCWTKTRNVVRSLLRTAARLEACCFLYILIKWRGITLCWVLVRGWHAQVVCLWPNCSYLTGPQLEVFPFMVTVVGPQQWQDVRPEYGHEEEERLVLPAWCRWCVWSYVLHPAKNTYFGISFSSLNFT